MRRRRLLGVSIALVLVLMVAAIAVVYSRKLSHAQPQLPAIGEAYYPEWGNSGYDTQHIDLSLAVDVKNNVLKGTEIIQAKASDVLKTFDLDLRGLDVQTVTVNDKAATFNHSDTKLSIQPAETIAKDADFTATITYSGTPKPYTSISDPSTTVGWLQYKDGVVILGEPDGAPDWFPVNDTPRDKATYTFHVTVDKPYTVFANGNLQNTTEKDNQATYTWDMDIPMASYLAVVHISPYPVHTEKAADGLPLNFVYPPSLEPLVKQHTGIVSDMIDYLSSIYGPYPFKSYGMIFVDPNSAPDAELHQEWQRTTSEYESQSFSVFFPNNAIDDSKVLHELAHQWFGDSVSLIDWGDLWLKEGFAAYSEWLWEEHQAGPNTIKNTITAVGWYPDFVASYQNLPAARPPTYDLYNATSYIRGKMTLEALRIKLGDDTFFVLLKEMATRYRYSNITTDDFIALASSVSGQDLKPFLTTWLYSTTLPSLNDFLAGKG
jgi:aminopeptidase N